MAALALLTACGSSSVAGEAKPLASKPDVSAIQIQDVASVSLKAKFDDSPQSVNAYWTTSRLKDATPAAPAPPKQAETPTPTPTPRASQRPAAPRSSVAPRTTAPRKTKPRTTAPRTTAPRKTKPRTTAPRTTTPRTTARPTPSTTAPSATPTPTPTPTATPTSAPASTAPASTAPPVTPRDGGTNVVIKPSRGKPDTSSVLKNSPAGNLFAKPGLTKSTAGRLYYSFGNQPYVCSGTVVNSKHGDVVATSAHCVWDTKSGKKWGHNYLFIPNDSNNGSSAPYGRWVGKQIWAPNAFITSAKESDSRGAYGDGWAYDNAFVQIAKSDGKTIQSVTGGQGIAFGSIAVTSLLTIGYPTAAPFDGRSERSCASSSWQTGEFGDRAIYCQMTPGCSGGGWLTDFDPATGAGYLVGTLSLVSFSRTDKVGSAAQMGAAALSAYNTAVAGKST